MNCPMKFPLISFQLFGKSRLIIVYLAFLSGLLLASFDLQATQVESLTRPVTDNGKFLSDFEIRELENKIIAFEDTTSTQIAVFTINSLAGENLEDYAVSIYERSRIGQENKNNGVLLMISRNDKRIRIEVGYGLEPVITDALAKRIIESILKPAFRKGNFYGGIDGAVTTLMKLSSGEFTADDIKDDKKFSFIWVFLIMGLIFMLIRFFGKRNNWENYDDKGRTRGSVWPWYGGGYGGGYGSSGGGGGFGGFGGGFSGGGGASGGW